MPLRLVTALAVSQAVSFITMPMPLLLRLASIGFAVLLVWWGMVQRYKILGGLHEPGQQLTTWWENRLVGLDDFSPLIKWYIVIFGFNGATWAHGVFRRGALIRGSHGYIIVDSPNKPTTVDIVIQSAFMLWLGTTTVCVLWHPFSLPVMGLIGLVEFLVWRWLATKALYALSVPLGSSPLTNSALRAIYFLQNPLVRHRVHGLARYNGRAPTIFLDAALLESSRAAIDDVVVHEEAHVLLKHPQAAYYLGLGYILVFGLTMVGAHMAMSHAEPLSVALVLDACALSYFPVSVIMRDYFERRAREYSQTLSLIDK